MLHFLLSVGKYLLVFLCILIIGAFVADYWLKSKRYTGPITDHFDGKKFYNLESGSATESDQDAQDAEQGHFSSFILGRFKSDWQQRAVITTIPDKRVEGDKLVVTFVNHATVLIQTQGLNILTDPIWSKRASPVSWIGPERYQDPGIRFEDLPPIDIVLVSHNHYDHMDLPTLKRLQEKFNPKVFVQLGNKAFLESWGINVAQEMDWWNEAKISEAVTIESVPAQHFSARALSDRNGTLWGGYVLKIKSGNIYFAGDTGYGPWVQRVAERFPEGFRLALLPIGAFKPRSFMKDVHVSPDEALKIKNELKAHQAIAIHFGTFRLASDKQDEPVERLKELVGTSTSFVALKNGEKMEVQ
jgi:L-ascorbate metabolism protein UlaG (beta-lactamase superfamily)